jgi:lipopolysaccharide transport system permease protein
VPHSIPRRLRIEPPRGWQGLKLAELWEYRELLFFFVWRDLKVRYKQTVLGAAWAIIQPLATTFLFTLFFGRLAGLSKQVNGPYSLYVFAALIPWTFFANAVMMSANSLVGSSHLISKVYFPRLLVPLAPVVVGLVDFGVAFAALLALMPVYGIPPGWHLLTVPAFVIGTLIASTGVGILFSAITVNYRDFRFVMTFLMQLWLFASPVAYALTTTIPARWQPLYAINPMVGMIAGFQASVLGQAFPLQLIAVSLTSAVVLFAIGVRYFVRVERQFADVI